MKYRLLLLCALLTVGALGFTCAYHNKYLAEKRRAEMTAREAEMSATVTANILRAMTITQQIQEANQNARQQRDQVLRQAELDINAATAHDACADRRVPTDAAQRLRNYADSLRSRPGAAAPRQPDR